MVGGQVDDLAFEEKQARRASEGRTALADLEFLHARKTGALFRVSLRMGVWAAKGEMPAGADTATLALFEGYGRCFGQAFQITDDLLDVEGSAEQTGKRVRKDAGRGKLTYPGLLGPAESRQRAEDLCQEACRILLPFGAAAERLAQLARYVVERDR